MEIPPEYRQHARAYRELWLQYMNTGSQEALRTLVSMTRHPQREKLPPPPVTWLYRHPDTREGDDYDWYSLLYDKTYFVGGRKFKRGSGRFATNSSSRHGRVDWHATTAAIRKWLADEGKAQGAWERAIREIDVEEFERVMVKVEGWDFLYGHDDQRGRVLREPGREFLVCTYGDLWSNSTRMNITVMQETYPDLSWDDRLEASKVDAPKRLRKMLNDYYKPWSWVSDGVDF